MAIAAALAVGWVGLIVLAPFLPPPAAGLLYLFSSRICHQLPERSFHIDGAQLPVCARCLGAYAGAAAGALAAVCGASLGTPPRRRGGDPAVRLASRTPPGSRHMRYFVAAAALNLATALVEWAGVWHPSNAVRAVAGALLGSATAVVVARVLWTRRARWLEAGALWTRRRQSVK